MNTYLVMVNYFCGWWRKLPNKWHVDGQDWRLQYAERIPALGCYNDQETTDADILAASENAVDCFMVLWYPQTEKVAKTDDVTQLNSGLQKVARSPYIDRMGFMIEYCNHTPFLITDDVEWGRIVDQLANYFIHPSYQRVGKKALFKIHGLKFFLEECGGDVDRARRRLEVLREVARKKGAGELLLSAGVMSTGLDETEKKVAGLFDYLSTYADMPGLTPETTDYPYEDLSAQAAFARDWYEKAGISYMPYVMAGWNPRPWKDPRPSFCFPNEEQWRTELKKVKATLDSSCHLGIPCGEGRQKAFNIYAWNEFGEGGILAPTLGEGDMKLRVIREVFGEKDEA